MFLFMWSCTKLSHATLSGVDRRTRQNNQLFSVPPPPPKFFWKITENLITNRLEKKPESFSYKFILRVMVYDSDTNFVHTFPYVVTHF